VAAGLAAAFALAGGLPAADAGAAVQSGAIVRVDAPGDCGPLHDDNSVPPEGRPKADDKSGRGERGSLAGHYCSGDTGNGRPTPQG
jgi:hypothetical protein